MEPWLQILITVISSLIASSGFWAFFSSKMDINDAKTEMLMGLAHDRIVNLGLSYIEKEYITKDEYENIEKYLFRPYKRLGGNGSATKIMLEVDKLPIYKNKEEFENKNK